MEGCDTNFFPNSIYWMTAYLFALTFSIRVLSSKRTSIKKKAKESGKKKKISNTRKKSGKKSTNKKQRRENEKIEK